MNLHLIREDLLNGMSIEDVCTKHKTNLKDLFTTFHGYQRKQTNRINRRNTKRPNRYIFIRNDTYAVRKKINGKTRIFGTYNSLEDAKMVRDTLEDEGWKQRSVDDICRRLNIQRRKGYINSKVRYS